MLSLEEQIERIADAAMTASLDEGDAAPARRAVQATQLGGCCRWGDAGRSGGHAHRGGRHP